MNEDGLIKRAIDKESFLGIDKFSTDHFAKLNSDSEVDLAKSTDDPFRRIFENMCYAILGEFGDEDLGEELPCLTIDG